MDNPLQTKLGGNLQTMDYSYWAGGFLHNINGGTTGSGGLAPTANDWPTENTNQALFAMELTYLANGNIANWKQQNRGFVVQNYAYTYDALQRIRTATNGTQSQTYQYKDALGNFSSLTRSDLVRNNGAWNLHDIDALTYAYANPLSSKIQSVADASNHPQGYLPNTGTYTYDANGNTTYDPANQISTVYNYLNLPSKFTKDNGATQEVVYDATGRKWQVREFTASDSLISSRAYLGSFEFEKNTLNLIRHPSGFIKNLQSTEYQTGRQNGDIHGASIVSTQKITEGKYKAENQITLLPGFEATAHDAFSAEIKPQSPQYQWQYVLADHLGNVRVIFADKNNDGLIAQSVNDTINEILSIRNYSPFGLELGGSHKNLDYQNPYRFGGKEHNNFTGYSDFGWRWYDSNRSGWNQVDPLAEMLPFSSSYVFTLNNPLKFIDPDGRYPWPVTIRSFISAQSAGGGLFYADNRGASFSGTSRVFTNFTVDPAKGSISNPVAKSNETIFFPTNTRKTGTPEAFITEKNFSEGSASFKFNHSGKDPITPQFVTPALDVHAGLTFKEDSKKGTLIVSGSFSGDKFPSTESFITDQSGKNKVFLGAQMEQGGVIDLYGDNNKPLFNVNIKVNFDKKGNFTGVTQGNKTYSVSDWNKKVQEDFKK